MIGLVAVLLWSSIVGLIRSVSDHLGPTGGAAMMYTVASVFLLLSVGYVKLSAFPRRYLIWGSLLFVTYELCLSLSIGYANTAQQAIEVGMVNYLWPTLTIVAAIVFNRQKANWLIVPGFLLSVVGAHRRWRQRRNAVFHAGVRQPVDQVSARWRWPHGLQR